MLVVTPWNSVVRLRALKQRLPGFVLLPVQYAAAALEPTWPPCVWSLVCPLRLVMMDDYCLLPLERNAAVPLPHSSGGECIMAAVLQRALLAV